MIKVKKKEKKNRKITTEEERCSNGNFGNLHPDCNLFFFDNTVISQYLYHRGRGSKQKRKEKKIGTYNLYEKSIYMLLDHILNSLYYHRCLI